MSSRRRPRKDAGDLAALGIRAGYPTATERARAVGCSRSHLLHCERGAVLPGLDLIERMGLAYGVSQRKVEAAAESCLRRLAARSRRGAA